MLFGLFGAERLGAILPSLRISISTRVSASSAVAADIAQIHAAFEQFDGTLQRQIAAFQLFDRFLQLIERGFESFGWLAVRLAFLIENILTGDR